MTPIPPSSVLCVDLDSLLDMRLAVLYTFGETAVQQVLNPAYFSRIADQFPAIAIGEFKRRYAARDRAVLRHGIATGVLRLVGEFVSETAALCGATPFHSQPKVYLNTYPYVLTEKEIQQFILGLVSVTHQQATIEVIHRSPDTLTIDWVKQEVAVLIMYDYPAWIQAQSTAGRFEKITCPDVTLFAPAIYFADPPPETETQEAILLPFESMERHLAPLISLKLLPVGVFSIACASNTTLVS